MPPAKAAFYDVDGTLVKTNVVHVYGYYAMNRGSLLGIAGRTLSTALSVPLFGERFPFPARNPVIAAVERGAARIEVRERRAGA